ncbi:glycosyl hydrolase [Edaphobacter sp. 12200R-103]|uniref:glycosyl hydrolase n=1 Tax=Edaphobacter sp. 12200R-103 TaxID=2703788 RepID=UPI00138C6B9F|nr:glycosyl hydrolase [Edaphobacter sp. 12200R-103]QHS52999.1 beta-galactosidase [Edaphobacter sp. 12200R-103]
MIGRAAVVLAGVVAGQVAMAQQPAWQRIQMPTAAEVARQWVSPPSEYGPEPYYGMGGAVNDEVIQRDLDRMKQLGYRAVTVQYGRGAPFAYLSPEYFAFFRKFVDEAKKRDMRLWIVDDAGYPSGFAGGKFTQEKPELQMQALVAAEMISVGGGEVLERAVKPETVAVTAMRLDGGGTETIPFGDGKIRWTAPAGEWKVTIVEHRFSTSPTRSDTNPKNVKDGSQSLEDYLDPAATEQFLKFTHEQYRKYVGDEFGKTILGFRGDEPDYSIRGLPWTPKFFERFKEIKGYDVRPYLAGLFAKPLEMTQTERRVKADYYDVFSQMFRDGFFKPQAEWCAANHLEYQVHLNHEEMEMNLVRSEGEFFRDMQYVQVPGIDAIWHQIWKDTISDYPRLASSVSHVYGHPRAFTESFAAYRPEPDVDMARYILNEQFVRGINLVETMYLPSSAGGRQGSPYMREEGYPALLEYVRRMSYLLSMGEPAAKVALYLPSSSMWMGDEAADKAFVSTERVLSERQIDFDIVSEDALANDLKAEKGTFATMSGNRYTTVILPGESVLSEAALDRLREFARGGGKVLFLDHLPVLISGKTYRDARDAKAADFAWAKVEVSAQLAATPTPPMQPPTMSPPAQMVPGAIAQAVDAAVQPDVRLKKPDRSLHVMRRRLKDADVYLLFNEGPEAFSQRVVLQRKGKRVEKWDATTGKVAEVKVSAKARDVFTELALKPYEMCVLVVR